MNVTVPRAMPVALAPPGPPRPPLVRHRSPRMLGGVAQGVATHVGVPLPAVRLGFVVTALAGGFGVVLYLWLWALVPAGPNRSRVREAGSPERASRGGRRPRR